MTSFANKKRLRFIITLGTGVFDTEGTRTLDQIIIEDFRAVADIEKAGGNQMGTLRAKIFGVSMSNMNAITTLQWKPQSFILNTVEVFAIDGPAETLVFAGNIVNAWGDYQNMPDVNLMIQAQAAFFGMMKPTPPRSFSGQVDVATVMAQIARNCGLAFENTGVNVQLRDIYLANTDIEQAKELAGMAGIGFYVDDKILAITASPETPRESLIPVISRETGLLGYPTFDASGVTFTTLFNPGVTFGGVIKLESDIQRAAGEWVVTSVSHRLESEKPGGAWFSIIRAYGYDFALAASINP